jgi:hypothetical protein
MKRYPNADSNATVADVVDPTEMVEIVRETETRTEAFMKSKIEQEPAKFIAACAPIIGPVCQVLPRKNFRGKPGLQERPGCQRLLPLATHQNVNCHRGSDEQMFGVNEQIPGRGQSD